MNEHRFLPGVGVLVVAVFGAFALGESASRVVRAGSASGATEGRALTVAEVYAKTVNGVVRIEVTPGEGRESYSGGPGRDVLEPSGSGFVYDGEGRIVTNEHVVADAIAVGVRLADGRVLQARLIAGDAASDVAVLGVDGPVSALPRLTMADSAQVEVGDGVVTIGSPFGMQSSLTSGIVSAVGRTISSPDNSPIVDAIQTDASINRGNSGGPLLDMHGNVIGLVSQFQSASGGSNGVAFAIPSNTVETVVGRLLARGTHIASHGTNTGRATRDTRSVETQSSQLSDIEGGER